MPSYEQLARVKRNVQRLAEQQAPADVIDAYVKQEGVTPAQLKATIMPKSAAEGVGAFEAGLISAGQRASDLWRGAKNLTGIGEQTPESAFAEEGRLMAPLREAQPLATAVGAAVPDTALLMATGGGATLPALAARAAASGGVLGAADPRSTALEGAALGAAGAGAGALAGRAVGAGVKAASRPIRTAGQRLKDFSREAAARVGAKDLSVKSLAKAERALGQQYDAALAGKRVPLTAEFVDDFKALGARVPKRARELVDDGLKQGGLTGRQFRETFTNLGKSGREEVRELREFLAQQAEEIIPDIAPLNKKWAQLRFLQGATRGKRLTPSASVLRNLDKYERAQLQGSSDEFFKLARLAQNRPEAFKRPSIGLNASLQSGLLGGGLLGLGVPPEIAIGLGAGRALLPFSHSALTGAMRMAPSMLGRFGAAGGGELGLLEAQQPIGPIHEALFRQLHTAP